MADWLASLRMTPGEYRANIDGLNLFFGAVLGVVMATTDTLGARDFALTLGFVASLVIGILYVSAGRHRIIYVALAALLIYLMPGILGDLLTAGGPIPPHLQPTLAVWLGFVVLVEYTPRARPDGEKTGAPGQ